MLYVILFLVLSLAGIGFYAKHLYSAVVKSEMEIKNLRTIVETQKKYADIDNKIISDTEVEDIENW